MLLDDRAVKTSSIEVHNKPRFQRQIQQQMWPCAWSIFKCMNHKQDFLIWSVSAHDWHRHTCIALLNSSTVSVVKAVWFMFQNMNVCPSRELHHSSSMTDVSSAPLSPALDEVFFSPDEQPPKVRKTWPWDFCSRSDSTLSQHTARYSIRIQRSIRVIHSWVTTECLAVSETSV